MTVTRLASVEGIVTGFCVGERYIDCMCGRRLLKLDRFSGGIVLEKEVFEKDGLSRKLLADRGEIFVYDFCTFYAFRQKDYEPLGKWRLGADLSSDICGMAAAEDTVYCSIRNGRLAAIDRKSHDVREAAISGSSMWSLLLYGDSLLCGTVDGRLLRLDRSSLSVESSLTLSKKNIASLYLDGDILYASSHDGQLLSIDPQAMQVRTCVKRAHKKMFHCAGIYGDMLATVSYPYSEIALWDHLSLERRELLEYPLRLSGTACIQGDRIYITSRNIPGIDIINLRDA